MERFFKTLKRFLTLFIPLATFLMVATLLTRLSAPWVAGCSPFIKDFLPILQLFLYILPARFLLSRISGVRISASATPIIVYSMIVSIVIRLGKDILSDTMVVVTVVTAGITAIGALFERQRNAREDKEAEASALKQKEMDMQRLTRFKTASDRQFYVVRNVEEDDIFYELDCGDAISQELEFGQDYLVFELPDGRFLVLLTRQISTADFQKFLSRFRDEAKEDLDVLGYLDRPQRDACQMMVADSRGTVKSFARQDGGYIPFDFSLLEKARVV